MSFFDSIGGILSNVVNIAVTAWTGNPMLGQLASGIFDSLRFWLKYQQIKEQWQKFHHFLHHRGDLCGSCKGVRSVKCSEKGVDVCGKQTCTHPGKAKQKEFSLPLSHTQSGDQQGRGHAKKYVFNICHTCTAFPVAGSSANRQPVSRRSNQQ